MFLAPVLLTMSLVAGEKVAGVPVVRPVPAAAPVMKLRKEIAIDMPFMPTQPSPTLASRPKRPSTIGPAGGPVDTNVLKAAKLGVADADVLEFFRLRTPPAPDLAFLREQVAKLKVAADRDKAQAVLAAVGQPAVPLLRTAANAVEETDLSAAARDTLSRIEGNAGSQLVIQAARQLAAAKPEGAAGALVAYLPFAEDETALAEIESALLAVALKAGKPEPSLVKALADADPLRRASAAQVLCQAGGASLHPTVRPLMKDDRPSVRLRAALGLAGAYDPEAVPVLIALMGEANPDTRAQAEEFLAGLAGEWVVSGPAGGDLMSRKLRREVWLTWWKATEGPDLLEEFRSRTLSDEDHTRISALVAQLGDDKAGAAEKAAEELTRIGGKAALLLRAAAVASETKAGAAAAKILESVEKDAPPLLSSTAARLLALRKPAGAVEALLAYLPFAESADARDQVTDILASVGVVGGKADPALVKALADKVADRRAAAVAALARGQAEGETPAMRKLLEDKDATVRSRAAMALAGLGERDALPVLIAALADLAAEPAYDAEEFLSRIAGEKSPNVALGTDAAGRAKAVEAWTKWYAENGKTVALTKADPRRGEIGSMLVVETNNPSDPTGRGRVVEMSSSGRILSEVKNLNFPNDALKTRDGQLLVAEQHNNVSVRDRKGALLRTNTYYGVLMMDKGRDGNLFLACRNQLMLVDAKYSLIWSHPHNTNTIMAGKRFRDGTMAYVNHGGQYFRLDAKGKELKSFTCEMNRRGGGNYAEILPGDRFVVSTQHMNRVTEYGPDGKVVWDCTINQPMSPSLASNGNILVPGNNQSVIYEIDRRGKIVRETKTEGVRPYRVVRR